jgi:hypothetical protein
MARNPREQFEAIRARYLKVEARREKWRYDMFQKYRTFTLYDHMLLASERKAREAISAADDKASDAMYALLDEVSPRQWRSGVPQSWVMSSLTWEDATTAGRMSVTPPCAWGSSPSDAVRFAAPVRAAE